MTSRVDRVNRAVLSLLGAILLVGGAAALAVGLEAFGADRASEPVLSTQWSNFIDDNPWYWWAVGAGCVIVALAALRWLVAQLQTGRIANIHVESDPAAGETVLRAGALADAVTADIRSMPGVRNASMRVVGTQSAHRYLLTVYLDGRADINDVRQRLMNETVVGLRGALDFDEPELGVRLVLAPRSRRTVS
jgi:hypothetical protein